MRYTRFIATATWLGASLVPALAAEPFLNRTDVFVGGVGGYHTYRIPALVVTDKGAVLAFCEGRKKGAGDAGDIDLLVKRSVDGGRSWSKQKIVHEEGGDAPITIGNPCPIVSGGDGVIHLLFTRNNKRLFYTRSLEDGLTWSAPVEHTSILKTFDFPVVRLGAGPVHGIRTGSGRLAAPVWLCDGEVRNKQRRYRSGIVYSDDEGRTWLAGGAVAGGMEGLNECTLFERKDGSLLLNMRAQGAGYRAISQSKDGGLSWWAPLLDKRLPCPTCQASSLGIPDQEVLFSNPAGSTRSNMTIRLSADGGETWRASQVLNKGPSGYSDLAVTKDGELLCLFECGEKRYNEKIVLARFNRAWILQGPR